MLRFNGSIKTADFSAEFVRIHQIRYSEGKRVTTVPGEWLGGKVSYVLYASCLRTWENGDVVTADEKTRIVGNLTRALREGGVSHEVEV